VESTLLLGYCLNNLPQVGFEQVQQVSELLFELISFLCYGLGLLPVSLKESQSNDAMSDLWCGLP
jgi:hypothetical protein